MQSALSDNVRFVLVGTLYAGNIGSVCRAMKNMGFSQLFLVDPVADIQNKEAKWLSASAVDVLESIQVVSSIEEAVSDCSLVIGTSARHRQVSVETHTIDELLPRIQSHIQLQDSIAILFGPEDSGLSNKMYELCHYRVYIESHQQYPVLNIAMSVMVIAYSLFKVLGHELDKLPSSERESLPSYPTVLETKAFYDYLTDLMTRRGFYDPENPQLTLPKLKRLFSKAGLEVSELRLLFGLLKSLDDQPELSNRGSQ